MDYSQNHSDRLQQLLEQPYWSEEDRLWLLEYLEQTDHEALRMLMHQRFEAGYGIVLSRIKEEQLLAQIHKQIRPVRAKGGSYKMQWKQWAVAASIALVMGIAPILYYLGKPERKVGGRTIAEQQDVAPGTNSALLTLADGTTIVLDSADNGTLARQGGCRILKLDGQVAYQAAKEGEAVVGYNTIRTLRGNQYQVVLADGSKVWLNAASSIRVPTAFTGNERRIQMTGEAYFEVAKDPSRPFKVESNGVEVSVLGTHFNVNAYEDEGPLKATLAEGKVRVTRSSSSVVLEPAQQVIAGDGALEVRQANVEKVLAWKTGMFEFDGDNLETIMRQITRWYNVEVHFAGPPPQMQFNGSIPREATLIQVLQILKLAGVSWSLKGKELTISSKSE